ncbi:MAG: LysR substrate-binding domain-containing protein, partial [Paracoccaceae bacterium]
LMPHPPVIGPEHLPEHPLLDLDGSQASGMTWRKWLSAVGVHEPIQREPLRINAYPLLLEEAKSGRGIALGWRHLVDADLAAGRLVRPVSTKVVTGLGYYLTWPSDHAPDPLTENFRDWLLHDAPGR